MVSGSTSATRLLSSSVSVILSWIESSGVKWHERQGVWVSVWCLCVCRGSKYSKVVSNWLILDADLYRTILIGGTLWTQFDDVVVLAVVFFALLSRSTGFQIFGNLKDIPLIWWYDARFLLSRLTPWWFLLSNFSQSPVLPYVFSQSHDCISSSALQFHSFYLQTWWLWCVLQLLYSMFVLFLPHRRLRNL